MRFGHLQVNVNAPECKVYVNGTYAGLANPGVPLNLENAGAGQVEVKVETKGYQAAQQEVRLAAGQWTPAVELQAALDDTAGTVSLTWSQYGGAQPFQEYRVLRNIADRRSVDTLVQLAAIDQTAYVDTALEPNIAYVYRVAVVNAGGYEAASEERSVAGYAAGPVSLLAVEVDGGQGQARLRWSRFRGGRFAEYRVERRRVEEEAFAVVQRLEGIEDTTWTDTELKPEAGYFYRVVVVAAGQDWPSATSSRQGFVVEAVQLLVATADPQGGTVRLRWGRFAGPDFQMYQLRRRVVGTDQEEVVGEVANGGDTTLVDGGARAGVDYEYRVVVKAGGQELFGNTRVARLVLPRVELQPLELRSDRAAAQLRWTPYTGPRFSLYQVVRRTAERAPQVVAQIADSTATAFVDSGLAGNTEYLYRVVVKSTYQEEIPSLEQRGIFHEQMDSWPLELGAEEYVRLSREREGITALVAGPQRVRVLFFEPQGGFIREQVLLEGPDLEIEPRTVATAVNEQGERFLSLGIGGREILLLRFAPEGNLLYQEREVFVDSLPLLTGPEGIVEGDISLRAYGRMWLDNVQVSRGEQVLFTEDFEDGEVEGWDYTILPSEEAVIDGRVLSNSDGVALAKRDEAWQDFHLEADVVFESASGAYGEITIGNAGNVILPQTHSRFTLRLDYGLQQLYLYWRFLPPPNSGLERQSRSFSQPLPVLPGFFYRLGLGFAAGKVSASVASPVFWGGAQEEGHSAHPSPLL